MQELPNLDICDSVGIVVARFQCGDAAKRGAAMMCGVSGLCFAPGRFVVGLFTPF